MDLRRRRTALQMGAALAASQHAAPLLAQTKRPATHEILVGQTAAVTGPFFASSSLDFNRGVNAHFAEVNVKGGVDGRKLRFISLDDGYDAEKAKADFKQLVEVHGVFALLGIGGTPRQPDAEPLPCRGQGSSHRADIRGGRLAHSPSNPYVFRTRASYSDEMARLVEQLAHRPKEGGHPPFGQRHRQIGGGRLWPVGQGSRAGSHADHAR